MIVRVALLALAWVGIASLYVDVAQSIKNCEYSYHKCLEALGYDQQQKKNERFFSGWFSARQRCHGCRACRKKNGLITPAERICGLMRSCVNELCDQ